MTTRRITCISMNRSRAEAATQRRLGLKVGGTMTEFSVDDGLYSMTIEAWGATPGARATIAKACFQAAAENAVDTTLLGAQCYARVVGAIRVIPPSLERTWRAEQAAAEHHGDSITLGTL
jgi:hypothetical protein